MIHLSQCFPFNYLESVIGPTSKLHLTILIIEGEPGDVDLAGGHEDPRRDVGALSLVGDHHVGWVGSVKGFTCAANDKNVNPPLRSVPSRPAQHFNISSN